MNRKDSFITHRAFCDALAEESARLTTNPLTLSNTTHNTLTPHLIQNPSSFFPFSTPQNFSNPSTHIAFTSLELPHIQNPNPNENPIQIKPENHHQISENISFSSPFYQDHHSPLTFHELQVSTQANTSTAAHMSATALLQKAAKFGVAAISGEAQAQSVGHMASRCMTQLEMDDFGEASHMVAGISPEYLGFSSENLATWEKSDRLTRDFLGLAGECAGSSGSGNGNGNGNVRDMLSFTGGVEFSTYNRDLSLLKPPCFGFTDPTSGTWGDC